LRLRGELIGLSTAHLEAGVEAMKAKPAGTEIHWPSGLRLVKRYADFRLCRGAPRPPALSRSGERLAIPGVTVVADGGWRVTARVLKGPAEPSGEDPLQASLDLTAAEPALLVRRRRPGDRFQPLGMAQEKKLQDFLVDAKVPREERDAVPIVATDGKIVWVVGFRPAEWARVRPETEMTLQLRFARLN
jgi:tRNA(Ile)-lysidine synthase